MRLRHVWTLILRALLLVCAVFLYFADRDKLDFTGLFHGDFGGWFLVVAWIVLVVGMAYRLIPNRRIAMGARKHYACSYRAAGTGDGSSPDVQAERGLLHKGALLSGLGWLVCSITIFASIALIGALTPAALMVVVLVYAVGDVVFVLFFCPFRVIFMRNRCCTVCRIYNWDYFMMCAPMILFPCVFSVSLVLLSAAVVIRWELALHKYPHFFMEETNENLRCSRCEDQLCMKKAQR